MSLFYPTTTMTVERASILNDEYGDEASTWAAIDGGVQVPAAYAERRKHVYDPTSGRHATITYGEALLPAHLQVEAGDRCTDHTTGKQQHVTHVHRPQNLAFPGAFLRVETEDPAA